MGYSTSKTVKQLQHPKSPEQAYSCRGFATATVDGKTLRWAGTVYGASEKDARLNALIRAKQEFKALSGTRTDLGYWIDQEIERRRAEKIQNTKIAAKRAEWIKSLIGSKCVKAQVKHSTLKGLIRRVERGEATVSATPSGATVNEFVGIISGALGLAIEADVIQQNVAKGTGLRRPQESGAKRPVTEDEFEQILAYLLEKKRLADAALVSVWWDTGFRPHSVARELKW